MRKEMFSTDREMFKEKLDNDKIDRYLNFIDGSFKEFIEKCYKHANKDIDDIEYENKVCEILLDFLIRGGFLNSKGRQIFIDLLITSAFLHNLYFDEKDLVISIVKPRAEFLKIAEELGMPEQYTDAIFEAIEAQLGAATPIRACKPGANTPQEILSEAVFVTRMMYKWTK